MMFTEIWLNTYKSSTSLAKYVDDSSCGHELSEQTTKVYKVKKTSLFC